MRIRSDISSDYISDKDIALAEIADALSHPLRVALLRYVKTKNSGQGVDNETCNKDLVNMFNYSQSTISQHIKILKNCGLFVTESKDRFTFYYVNIDLLNQFKNDLDFI